MIFSRLLVVACVAFALAGCQGRARLVQSILPPPPREKVSSAPVFMVEAEAALARSDFSASISFAELAVRAAPENPLPRIVLAKAYLGGGRVLSAQQAYGDVLDLTPTDPKARLGRALARLAGGDRKGAITDLEAIETGDGNPDTGLALALAGESARGVELLTNAARSEAATPRVRQNLALALALDGQWVRARAVAAQDLDPVTIDERIRQWTAMAADRNSASRAATFLAIIPRADDSGRPLGLAWIAPSGPPAAGIDQQVLKESVVAIEPVRTTDPAPVVVASADRVATITADAGVRWVVQLGAYKSATQRNAAWLRAKSGKLAPLLGDQAPLNTLIVNAEQGTLHRLSIGHFADRDGANFACQALVRAGAECLVRGIAQASPTQFAAKF